MVQYALTDGSALPTAAAVFKAAIDLDFSSRRAPGFRRSTSASRESGSEISKSCHEDGIG